jgi:hypothetical protein
LHLRYLQFNPSQNNFNLLIDKGDQFKELSSSSVILNPAAGGMKNLSSKGTVPKQELEHATKDLMNYFFIGLALPNDKFWVNLRPDSPDNIIDPLLAKTDIGRILLEADV